MDNQFEILLNKLNKYIKRYFLYQLLFGTIICIVFLSFLIIALILLDSNLELNSNWRAIFFYTSLFFSAILLLEYIFNPIVKLLSRSSRKQQLKAAKIISKKIDEVDDKLINILELDDKKSKKEINSISLINASIEQKAFVLQKIKFIDLISIRKVIYRIGIITLLILILGFTYKRRKDIIKTSTLHYINYNQEISSIRQLSYKLLNGNLLVEKGDNITVKFRIEAIEDNRPVINYFNNSFHLSKDSINYYSYLFNSVNRSFEFNISVNMLKSKKMKINVLDPPTIIDFRIEIIPPEYTAYIKQDVSNIGDITIIEGSKVVWTFNVEDVDLMLIKFRDNEIDSLVTKNGENTLSKRIVNSSSYSISLYNEFLRKDKILNYRVDVIKDKFPIIEVKELNDSAKMYAKFFYGLISDDYGIEMLHFTYYKNRNLETIKFLDVPIIKSNQQEFFYYIDFDMLDMNNEDVLTYYFEVWDNDIINGYKSTRSDEKRFRKLTKEEKKKSINEKFVDIERKMQSAMSISNDISNEIEKFNQKAFNNNIDNFEIKSLIENISKKKKDLEDLIKEISKENLEKNLLENLNKKEIDEIRKKQKEIQELLDNILTDEIKKLIEELRELIKSNLKEEDINDVFKNLELDFEELTKQMESNLELLKKFEVENRINQSINDLKDLSEEIGKLEKELKKQSSVDTTKSNEIGEKKEEFLKIMEEYDKTKKLNNELKYNYDLMEFEEERSNIRNDITNSEDDSKNEKNKKSAKSLKSAAEKIDELATKMQNQLNSNMQNSISLNIDLLNSIINNLSGFSFDQEKLLEESKNTSIKDPHFIEEQKSQLDLNAKFNFINDQIDTLSYSSPVVSSILRQDISNIIKKNELIQQNFINKNRRKIATNQQFVMTSANNLVLKLDELLNSMQESGNSGMSSSNCDKPGKPKPGFGDLKNQQKGFKNQLQDMINGLKSGKGESMNKELSKMLAKQEIMRNMIDEFSKGENIGKGTTRELNEIKKLLDENIRDIVQRKIDNNMLKRQDLIRSRLLKAEKAELEREEEKRRVSKENMYDKKGNIYKDFEYNKENYNFNELLNKESIKFNNFYKNKSKQYYDRISN